MSNLATLFIFFMFYSFVGWVMEVLYVFIRQHKIRNRGFLIGPICPIYGLGAVLIEQVLGNVENVAAIFCVSVVGCGLLEYLTSVVMEKLFHVRWWDYSYMKFHLNGRICLLTLIIFGVLGVLAVKFVNPIIFGTLDEWGSTTIYIVASVLLILLIVDIIVSLTLILRFRVTAGTVNADATDEITDNIKDIFKKDQRINRRLLKAFPNLNVSKNHIKSARSHQQNAQKSHSAEKSSQPGVTNSSKKTANKLKEPNK